MRVMVIVKANKESEAGVLPDREILAKMGSFNEELVKAGVTCAQFVPIRNSSAIIAAGSLAARCKKTKL